MTIRYILLLLLLLIASPSQAQLLDDLEAYWKLDEASDVDAVDATGNGNTLTDNNGVPATTGILNNGRSSTAGNSEKLSIADNAALSFADEDFTISFWWQRDGSADPILGKWAAGSNEREYVVIQSGNKIRFLVSSNGTSATGDLTTTTVPSDAALNHIVCYHDSTANEIGVIINDGTPETLSYSGGCRDGASPFEIFAYDTTYATTTSLDEIGIWRRKLTSGEITSLYNSGSGLSYDSFASSGDPNPLTPTIPGGTPDPLKRILP